MSVSEALEQLAARGVPAGEVRSLDQLFADEQVTANGLVQTVESAEAGPVRLLGSVFKVDGVPTTRGVPAPGLDEHRAELFPA